MRTRSERGKLDAPVRLLEMLAFRFGALETIAYAEHASEERALRGHRRCTGRRPMQSSSSPTISGRRAMRGWSGRKIVAAGNHTAI